MSLDGGFEEVGQFWLADDADAERALPGKLTVDRSGSATIEVFSPMASLAESLLDPDLRNASSIRILGVTETNRAVTMDHARFSSPGRLILGKRSGVRRMDFWSDELVVGHHYGQDDEIRFDHVTLSLEHVYEWFGLSGLQSEEYSFETQAKVMLNYERPSSIAFQLPHGISGRVRFGFTDFVQPTPWEPKLGLKQTCSISLDSSRDSSRIYWHLDDVKELSLIFLSFFAMATSSTTRLVTVDASLHSDARGKTKTESVSVSLIYNPYGESTTDSRTLHPNEMLFTYEDVQAKFEVVMSNWLEYWQQNEYAVRATMRSRFGHLTLDDHLRTLTQALEIAVGKDIGANATITEIAQRLAENFWTEWDDDLDVRAFANAVGKYRNWFVHFDRKRSRIDVDYGEVAMICHNLGALLDIYMLSKCVPDDIPYRDLITQDGDLKRLLRNRLQLHAKHRR